MGRRWIGWAHACVALAVAVLVACGTASAASGNSLKFTDSHKESVKKIGSTSQIVVTSSYSITASIDLTATPLKNFKADSLLYFYVGGYELDRTSSTKGGVSEGANKTSFDKTKKMVQYDQTVESYWVWDDATKLWVKKGSAPRAKVTVTYDEKKCLLSIKVSGKSSTLNKVSKVNDGFNENLFMWGVPAALCEPYIHSTYDPATQTYVDDTTAKRGPTGEGDYCKALMGTSSISYTTATDDSDWYFDYGEKDWVSEVWGSGGVTYAGKAPAIKVTKGVTVDGIDQMARSASIKGTGTTFSFKKYP